MSHYPQDSSFSSDGYQSPGGRPLSGAGMNPAFAPANVDSFQQPRGDAGGYSEGESIDVIMPYIGGDDERRNSLTAMGDMLKAGPMQSDNGAGKKKSKKKDKDSGGGGLKFPKPPSIDVRGSFRKIKGKFSRGKDKEPLQHAASHGSIEVHEQAVSGIDPQMMPEITPPGSGYATPQPFDPHPGGYDLNPTDTLPRKDPGKMDSMKASMKGWFSPTVSSAPPSRYSPGDVAELKPMPGKYPIRMSTIIYFLLGLALVIGIILTAMGSNSHYSVVGPLFIGLSIFAIIGKVFFTLFWEDEPCPHFRPYITQVENAIGGAKDPYRHKQSLQSGPNMYMPQMSPTAVPLTQFSYPYVYPSQDTSRPPSAGFFPPGGSQPAQGYYPPTTSVGYNPPNDYPQSMGYTPSGDNSYDDYRYPEKVPLGNDETMDTKMG